MTEHRWSKFWWQDYAADDALRVVSLGAQGLWMRMLCAMHNGTPYGHLTINGKPPTPRQIAAIASAPEREVLKYLAELEAGAVFSRTEDGTIFNRRMVRDKALSEKGREDGKRGGNPILNHTPKGEGLTPPDNGVGYTLEAEADTEAESKKKEPPQTSFEPPQPVASPAAPPPRQPNGSRLPDEWQPDDPAFAGCGPNTLAKFRDYWRAQPGAKGRKTDWQATWRNWCRSDAERRTETPARKTSALTVSEQNMAMMRLIDRAPEEPDQTQLRIVG